MRQIRRKENELYVINLTLPRNSVVWWISNQASLLLGGLVSGKNTLVSQLNAIRLAIQPFFKVVYIQSGTSSWWNQLNWMCFPLKITRGRIDRPSAEIASTIDTHSRSLGDYTRVLFFKASPSLIKLVHTPNAIPDSSIFQLFSAHTPLIFRTLSKRS